MRDIINHGSGKGDKSRVSDNANYRKRLDEIQFPRRPLPADGFILVRGKWVKKYT